MKVTVRVVSLQASRERREATVAHLGALGLPFRFADAIDGKDAAQVARAFVCRPEHFSPAYTHRAHPVSGGELACTLSQTCCSAALTPGYCSRWCQGCQRTRATC